MKRLLMIVPIIMCYSCATMYTTIESNVNFLNADSLRVTYDGENYALPLKDKDVYYTNEFEFQNIGADTLYSICRIVMPDIFNSAESVIQMEDATLKTIVGKGISVKTYSPTNYLLFTNNVNYTIRVQCFNNKMRISVYNMHVRNLEATSLYTQGYKSYYITDAVTRGLDSKGEVQDNTHGALIFAFYDTSLELQDTIVKKVKEYLKDNF